MYRKKNIFTNLLILLVIIALLGGCGNKDKEASKDSNETEDKDKAELAEETEIQDIWNGMWLMVLS